MALRERRSAGMMGNRMSRHGWIWLGAARAARLGRTSSKPPFLLLFLDRRRLGRRMGFDRLRRRLLALLGAIEDEAGVVVHVARKRLDAAVGGKPQPVGDKLDQRTVVGDEDDGALVVVER